MESSTMFEKSRMTVKLIMIVLHLIVFDLRSSADDCCRFGICRLENSTITGTELTLWLHFPCNETAKNFGKTLIVLLGESAESNRTCSETTLYIYPSDAQNLSCVSFNSSCGDKIILSCINNGSETDENTRLTLILKYSFCSNETRTCKCNSDNGSISFNCTYRGHEHCIVSTPYAESVNCTNRNLTYKCYYCHIYPGQSSESMTNNTTTATNSTTTSTMASTTNLTSTTVNGLEIISMCTGDKWAFCLTVGSIGFAAALFLVLLVMMLHCCRKRCCKKSSSPSDSEVDRKKQTEYADPKNGNTLNPHSSEKLGSNTGQHPVTYELISESVSPYEEATGPKETTNTSSLYAEVAADRSVRSRSMKKGNAKSDGRVSTMKIEATGDVGLYDDAATINAALNPKDNTSNDYEFATAVGDTVAPVYCDATKMKETTTQSCTKDQKPPRSPFAMNHANTMKSPGNKFSGLRPDSGNDIYDDAAIVNMNRTEMNEDSQYDDGGDVYQEASTVKLEKLDDSKYPSDGAKQFQAKLSNDQSKGGHGKHGKEMDFYDEDLTLVENGLYGQHKAK